MTIGLACWITASTLAAPVNDCAPICIVSEPSCSAITAPKGIATSAAGSTDTLTTNQNCSIELAELERPPEAQPEHLEAEGEQPADLGQPADGAPGSRRRAGRDGQRRPVRAGFVDAHPRPTPAASAGSGRFGVTAGSAYAAVTARRVAAG